MTMITPSKIAKSAKNNDVLLYTLGHVRLPKFVVIGGIHGDEPEGAKVVEDFVKSAQGEAQKFKACVLAIPRFNPDGLNTNERTNGHGVDLNRNFPADDWSPEHRAPRYFPGAKPSSESEIRGLVDLLTKAKPFLVVHCHTYTVPQICYTGEQSAPWAQILGKTFGYPVTPDIGYPTPGSLGQFCFLNLKTACICVEFPEQVEADVAWKMLGPSLLEIARRGP